MTLKIRLAHLRRACTVCLLGLGAIGLLTTAAQSEPPSLLLATTTSVQDSGLLDLLLPAFTERTGIRVRTVAVGTGAALRMGAEGDADILLTHAPSAERPLVESQAVSQRVEIMDNYFVIAGPPEDPAQIASTTNASQAMQRIHATQSPFVSRSDDSGTHKKEGQLLQNAGLDPKVKWPGLTRTGSGMGASLLVAGQRRAYILSDIGTFLAFRDRINLTALTPRSPDLKNTYSVLLVNPKRFPEVRAEEARQLAEYLQSANAQALMKKFGQKRFGQPLFSPLIGEPSGH